VCFGDILSIQRLDVETLRIACGLSYVADGVTEAAKDAA
jgi:hypothetical protein